MSPKTSAWSLRNRLSRNSDVISQDNNQTRQHLTVLGVKLSLPTETAGRRFQTALTPALKGRLLTVGSAPRTLKITRMHADNVSIAVNQNRHPTTSRCNLPRTRPRFWEGERANDHDRSHRFLTATACSNDNKVTKADTARAAGFKISIRPET